MDAVEVCSRVQLHAIRPNQVEVQYLFLVTTALEEALQSNLRMFCTSEGILLTRDGDMRGAQMKPAVARQISSIQDLRLPLKWRGRTKKERFNPCSQSLE